MYFIAKTFFIKVSKGITAVRNSGVFSTGAIAPVILRKRLIAPVIFTWEGFKSWTNFTQESYQMI